jgi:polysaccharide biosynthesis protein PslG
MKTSLCAAAAFLLTIVYAAQAAQPNQLDALKNTSNGFGITITDLTTSTLDKAVGGGFTFIRTDLHWGDIEQVKGRYNWAAYDKLLQELKRRKLRAMFILAFNNPHYNPTRDYMGSIDTRTEIEGFKKYAAAAVERYKNEQVIWEFYNEPNRPEFWRKPDPIAYMQLVKSVVPTLRKVDPDAVIIGPALGHKPNANPDLVDNLDYGYLEKVLKSGLLEYVDAVSIHPYPDGRPEILTNINAKVQALIKKYARSGKATPVINSEWGYSTSAFITRSAQTHADYWTRIYLMGLAEKMPMSIGYKLEYTLLDPTLTPYELGFMLFNSNGKPKLAYKQVGDAIRMLRGLSFVKRSASSPDVYLLEFTGAGKTIVAAWSTAVSRTVIIFGKPWKLTGKPIFVRK